MDHSEEFLVWEKDEGHHGGPGGHGRHW